ncbi:MAG: DNA polymerase III subunit alpha [Patescibacteria group bacterium]
MSKPNFVHLHVHSHYSLLDGLGKVPELVGRAVELGMPALAITDHGVMYGAIDFYLECQKQGIKPIVGVEAYVARRKITDKTPGEDTKPYHLLLLAKNFQGYQNLIKLTSAAHLDGYYYKPRIDRDLLSRYSEGLIASTACLASETSRLIGHKDFDGLNKTLGEYREIFGKDNYYLELQHHPSIPEQHVLNTHLKDLSVKTGLPLIATNDVHYINSDDRVAHDQLVCIQTGKLVSEKDRMVYAGDFSLKPPQEMLEAFSDVPEAISNTLKIAQAINLEIPLGQSLLPRFQLPSGETEESLLRAWCEKGLHERYGEITMEVRARLDYELETVFKTGFPGYFLIVADMIKFARSKGIYIGPGRGSAAGSIIAYVTGITNVDPIKYGLLFERFLDLNRISMPDIDMDFEDTRRGEVIEYLKEKYGANHVAGIITFGTIMARAAVRDVGRVLGVPYAKVDTLAKLIPPPVQGRHVPLAKMISEAPELKATYDSDPENKQLLDAAVKLEGTIRHASQHACAIVISKEPLENYVAVQAAQGGDVHQITQYSMLPIEKIGLLKMDLLGLSNLTTMHRATEIIEAVYGDKIDIENLSLDDKKTFELLARGETTGVFQLECLSGDTIVSNSTIRRLYEKQYNRTLESVYVDEGKVHRNRVLRILKGPKKQLFNLIATNGWFIKASADHHFMTDMGWKKLSELETGNKVLLKTRAKHLVFNTCTRCGCQISGQNEGKSDFCYRCSATHYRNPSKPMSRQRIAEARHRFYEHGGEPWNLGLTKENNRIMASTGRKISKSLTGQSNIDKFGVDRAEEIRLRMSAAMRGKKNHMFGVTPPHRHGGYRKDLGHYVRSNWEADFARILLHQGLSYEYEPRTFPVTLPDGSPTNYTPDFYIPSQETYYEIKGWLHDDDRLKMEEFQRQYPDIKLVIIGATKFAEFALKYRSLVAWECPRIPPGFDYVTVKEVRPAGAEDTYDIRMQSPGNNYVANGFVVHNSSGMRRYIKELRPTKFEDITAMVSLYRPGPMQWIQSFIDRKNGLEEIKYLHPLAESALRDTYGIPVYQEQVMRMSKDMCGFTGAEADTLRKAMGKKIPKLMKEMKVKFIDGAVSNGVSKEQATDIFRQLEDFAAYAFNKSHATCYAMIAFQTAYLKAHYPDCFMAALMTSDLGDIDRLSIEIVEAERLGLTVLPPDVNESFSDFGVVKQRTNSDSTEEDFAVVKEKNALRFGLGAIKNVGTIPAKAIVKERKKGGSYESLTDFLQRNSTILNKKILENLIRAGALDRFEQRARLNAGIELLTKFVSAFGKTDESQLSIFGEGTANTATPLLELPQVPVDPSIYLVWEKELLGLYLSDHPLKQFSPLLADIATPISGLDISQAGQVVRVGGIIQTTKKITTKNGQTMGFIELEDLTGMLELVVFPSHFQELTHLWKPDTMVLIEGKISDKDNSVKVLVDRAWALNGLNPVNLPKNNQQSAASRQQSANYQSPKADSRKLTAESFIIDLPPGANKKMIAQLKEILESHPGSLPVELRMMQGAQLKILSTKLRVEQSPELKEQLSSILKSS